MTIKDDGVRSSRYWRQRAEETRAKALQMRGDAQSALLDIAALYDRIATRAAEREAKQKLP